MRRGRVNPASEAASSAAADQKPKPEFLRKEGWLDKLSPRSILKDVWQKRWVVVAEGELCYYKDADSEPLGVVPLSHVEKITGEGNRIIFSMLPQYSSREWKWRADSAHDAQQWREALEEVRLMAIAASEVVTRYSQSGVTDGKYWKRLDPAFKQQSLIAAGRSHRKGSTAGSERSNAANHSVDATSMQQLSAVNEGEEVENVQAPRWARKRGASQADKPKEVLYLDGVLTKLNKGLGSVDRFYVLNGNKMTGYKNSRQEERVSTWLLEQLTFIEVVKEKGDGRVLLSLEMNGIEKVDLVGRSEDEIRRWAAKLAAAHVQFGGALNLSELMLHGSGKKSALYKQLEAQDSGAQSGTIIDLWCSSFDDKASKDLKSFLDASHSIDAGLLTKLEAELLAGTDVTKSAMQSLHDCLYGVVIHFIDDWQQQTPALLVPFIDWLSSYTLRLKRMGTLDLYPDILNLPVAKQMIEHTCPFVSGPLFLPKNSGDKSKLTKRWFVMHGSRINRFESADQEESGAAALETTLVANIVAVERDGKHLILSLPKESSSKKTVASKPEGAASDSHFPPGFVSDLVKRLVCGNEDGTLPFDSSRPFPGYELVEWICSITDLSYKAKRRDITQGLGQSLLMNGAIARADGGVEWDEDVDYMVPIEEESLTQLELVAEREDSAIVWQMAIECVRRSLTDRSRRRFGSGTPEIKTRFESEGQEVILDEVQSMAIDVFQKCDDLPDFLAGSQKLLDHAASYLDDLMFEEDFKLCFDFVFDCFFSKAFSVVINYCKENHHHWRQFEFIALATWASAFESRVLQYDESKLDLFNVIDQDFFVDLMDMYNEAVSQDVQRLVMNLISEDIKAKSEPLVSSEGHMKSLAIVDLMAIYNQSLSLVIGTGNAVVVTSTIRYTLPVLELFPRTYLQRMLANASNLPVEHICSVLNAFHEGSHCVQNLEDQLRSIVPEKFFEQLSFDGPSGAFNRAWKEGSKILVQAMGADIYPLIQKVGDKSWLNGSVTANWLATVRDYFGDFNRWLYPAVFRKMSADALDDNLRFYVKAVLAAKINCDETFVERADADVDTMREVFVEFARINVVSARIGLATEFVELLACDYDDVRRGFMSLVLSSDINVGILEKILELRDCKRSVKKDIIEECRVGWQEPEASDDEATYALVTSGIDIRLIPAGGDKFTMFSECPVAGIWPEWKERRDKERKDRFTALKARKDAALLRLKERDNQAEKERRAESLAASQMAREAAKRLANERAAAANAAKTKSGSSADRDKGKSRVPISVSELAQDGSMRRESTDLSLSEIQARDKAANKFLGAINRSGNSQHDHVVDAAAAFASVTKHASSNSSQPGAEPVKETMKEKIARQKREAELAATKAAAANSEVQSNGAENNSGKETLKEKIARQKREADLASTAAASPVAPPSPTMASFDADTPTRSRSESSAGKETLKEKIARQKRESELAAAPASPSTSASTSADANVARTTSDSSAGKETIKEKITRQKMEAELAAMSTSDNTLASPASANSEVQSNGAENNSGKETLKEKIARQKREADLASTAAASPVAPPSPTMASFDADTPTRSRSESYAGKETLKEKIARAKREAEMSADSNSDAPSSPVISADYGRPRAESSAGKETLKERIARQKLEAEMAGRSPTAGDVAASPQRMNQGAIIGGLAAGKKGSTSFIRSIQKSSSNSSELPVAASASAAAVDSASLDELSPATFAGGGIVGGKAASPFSKFKNALGAIGAIHHSNDRSSDLC